MLDERLLRLTQTPDHSRPGANTRFAGRWVILDRRASDGRVFVSLIRYLQPLLISSAISVSNWFTQQDRCWCQVRLRMAPLSHLKLGNIFFSPD